MIEFKWTIDVKEVDNEAVLKMAEYMIDRASNIHSWVLNGSVREGEKEDLKKIHQF